MSDLGTNKRGQTNMDFWSWFGCLKEDTQYEKRFMYKIGDSWAHHE